MEYNKETVNQILLSNDIVDVISSYIQLTPRGKGKYERHVGRCPFHSEKTESLVVNRNMGIFKCFGCGAKGNVITFIEMIEGFGTEKSVEFLAHRSGIDLSVPGNSSSFQNQEGGE